MSAPENPQRKYLETNLPTLISKLEQFVAAHDARTPAIERTGAIIGLGPPSIILTTADCLAGLGFPSVANEVRKVNEQWVDWHCEICTPAWLADQIAKQPENAEQLLAQCACYTDEQMTATPEQRLKQEEFFCLTLRQLARELRRLHPLFASGPVPLAEEKPLLDEIQWSQPDRKSAWAKKLGMTRNTFLEHRKKGKIRVKEITRQSICIAENDLPQRLRSNDKRIK
jgi:hypothetical protein